MHLLLSSGDFPQYREDIVRALAMPAGSVLQFRYQTRWVAPSIEQAIREKKFESPVAVIAYVDQSDKATEPRVVPCRFATAIRARAHGSTVSVQLRLGAFGYAEDLGSVNKELRSGGNQLPRWESGKVQGLYWLETSRPNGVAEAADLTTWEKIVTQIGESKDFESQGAFFHILGVRQLGTEENIAPSDGRVELRALANYEIPLYHFHPRAFVAEKVEFKTDSPYIRFTSSPRFEIASRYDWHELRFHVSNPQLPATEISNLTKSSTAEAQLSLYRIPVVAVASGVGDVQKWEFDLPLLLRGNWWAPVRFGILVGVMLAIPQLLIVNTEQTIVASGQLHLWANVLVIVANLAAGAVAALGLRKPTP